MSEPRPSPGVLEIVSTTEVDAPSDRVWEAFAEPSRWPEFSAVVRDVWGVSDDVWRVGGTLSFRLEMAGVGVPFSVRVVHAEPGRRIAWWSRKGPVSATRVFTFERCGAGTLVTDHKRFESALPIRWFYPRGVIRRMSERWLADLAREAERG